MSNAGSSRCGSGNRGASPAPASSLMNARDILHYSRTATADQYGEGPARASLDRAAERRRQSDLEPGAGRNDDIPVLGLDRPLGAHGPTGDAADDRALGAATAHRRAQKGPGADTHAHLGNVAGVRLAILKSAIESAGCSRQRIGASADFDLGRREHQLAGLVALSLGLVDCGNRHVHPGSGGNHDLTALVLDAGRHRARDFLASLVGAGADAGVEFGRDRRARREYTLTGRRFCYRLRRSRLGGRGPVVPGAAGIDCRTLQIAGRIVTCSTVIWLTTTAHQKGQR